MGYFTSRIKTLLLILLVLHKIYRQQNKQSNIIYVASYIIASYIYFENCLIPSCLVINTVKNKNTCFNVLQWQWAIPQKTKNKKTGGEWMEDMEISRGILEKGQACRNPRGQLKREVGFPGVFKKNSCGISMGLVVFDLVLETSKHEARGVTQQFCRISNHCQWQCNGERFFFSGISKGKVTNIKFPSWGFRKTYPQHPFDFFLTVQIS